MPIRVMRHIGSATARVRDKTDVLCFIHDPASTSGLAFALPLAGLRPLGSSQTLISGVDASFESLLVCNSQQKSGERIALLPTETREQSFLVLPRHAADLFQGFLTALCQ